MPTALRRHQVTETPALRHALEVAARRWPELTAQSALIAALAEEGARAVEHDEAQQREERRRRLAGLAGGFHYEAGYLASLREDWPE